MTVKLKLKKMYGEDKKQNKTPTTSQLASIHSGQGVSPSQTGHEVNRKLLKTSVIGTDFLP